MTLKKEVLTMTTSSKILQQIIISTIVYGLILAPFIVLIFIYGWHTISNAIIYFITTVIDD
jgi:hypothetical protein